MRNTRAREYDSFPASRPLIADAPQNRSRSAGLPGHLGPDRSVTFAQNRRSRWSGRPTWYNIARWHSGIAYLTPHGVHYGQAGQLRGVRQAAPDEAFLVTPKRFKGAVLNPMGCPRQR